MSMNTAMPKKGFTLVETMVAVTVLAIALTGPFAAVENALSASYVARDELIASSLAQEGMEYIRSIRDNNYLNSASNRTWLSGISTLSCYMSATSYCTVDPTVGDVNITPSAIAGYSQLSFVPPLSISASGIYNQASVGTPTRFTRSVQFRQVAVTNGQPSEIQVTVRVSWTSAHQTYSVTVVDNLQDWL